MPRRIITIWLALLLTACAPLGSGPAAPGISGNATATPFQPVRSTPSAESLAPSTPGPASGTLPGKSIWISPAVPDQLRELALASGFGLSDDPASASVFLDIALQSTDRVSTWIYALVTPFPTTTDDVPLDTIQSAWKGSPAGDFGGQPIWMTTSTLAAFSAAWGKPAQHAVSVAAANQLIDEAWSNQPAWAIVPFEDLEPRWKVLSVDGQSPVHNDFNSQEYGLSLGFSLHPAVITLPAGNRDPDRLTVLAMTGVTALVRATADRMAKKGVLYPDQEIGAVLRSADLTHVSNEVSFYADCPTPDPWTSSLRFCSDPADIALLEDIGVDIVELTGNHLLDYGSDALRTTLDMYDQRGWLHFGGGWNLADAVQPVKVTNHGNRLAFLGCNPVGPPADWATAANPGAAPCDYTRMKADLASLRAEGYLPIVTFQYNEYYQSFPTDYEQRDFRAMADAGAVIVSGSQAHMPASMELYHGSFVHYGLGNLFFDQMSIRLANGTVIEDTRNIFVDRHIFYDGRYIGTELLTYRNEDYAQPRVMTAVERRDFLSAIFSKTKW